MAKTQPITVKYKFSEQDLNKIFWTTLFFPEKLFFIFLFVFGIIATVRIFFDWIFNILEGVSNPGNVIFSFDWYLLFLCVLGFSTFLITSYLQYKKSYADALKKEFLLIIEKDKIVFKDVDDENKRTSRVSDIKKISERAGLIMFYFTSSAIRVMSLPERFLDTKAKTALLNFGKKN